MQNLTTSFVDSEPSLPVADLAGLARHWLMDTALSDRSPKTIKSRRDLLDKLRWWLARQENAACGVEALRGLFLYHQKAHTETGGRWGNPKETRPLQPLTLKTYYGLLRAFFNWCVEEGRLPAPDRNHRERKKRTMTAYAEHTDPREALVLAPGEGNPFSIMGNKIAVKAGGTDSAGAFSIWEADLPPHFPGPFLHWHTGYEVFYVLEGRIDFRLGEEERSIEGGPGAFVLVPPHVLHTFANPQDSPAAFWCSSSQAALRAISRSLRNWSAARVAGLSRT